MATIFDVANYFRWRTDYEAGDSITPLKLQKLCYYAQAWHVTLTGKRLFDEEFERWDHGPANYELYKKYESYQWRPIPPEGPPDDITDFYPAEVFTSEELDTLNEVWEAYGDYSAKFLENLTHREDPWLMAGPNQIITVESMKEYYSKRLRNGQDQ